MIEGVRGVGVAGEEEKRKKEGAEKVRERDPDEQRILASFRRAFRE